MIANTVDSAQKIYGQVQRILRESAQNDVRLLLFHARFRAERRQEIEKQVLELFDKRSLLPLGNLQRTERPRYAILVATQVVEQSLDLDFDEMFTEMAPIDLLLQRAGRLHRHDRSNRPTGEKACLHLLLPRPGHPEFGSKVYHRFIMLKTLAVLEELSTLHLPQDIRELIEMVYDGLPEVKEKASIIDPQDLKNAWTDFVKENDKEESEARRYLIPRPYKEAFKLAHVPTGAFDDDQSDASSYFTAKTRLDDETRQLLLLEREAFAAELASEHPPSRQVLKDLFLRAANIPKWWLSNVEAEPGFDPPEKGPPWLPGVTVLRLVNGCWRGRGRDQKSFIIRDDEELGLIREEGA